MNFIASKEKHARKGISFHVCVLGCPEQKSSHSLPPAINDSGFGAEIQRGASCLERLSELFKTKQTKQTKQHRQNKQNNTTHPESSFKMCQKTASGGGESEPNRPAERPGRVRRRGDGGSRGLRRGSGRKKRGRRCCWGPGRPGSSGPRGATERSHL